MQPVRLESGKAKQCVSSLSHPLLDIMEFDPIHVDFLAQHVRTDIGSLNAELLMLELAGEIEILPGGICRRLTGA